MLLLPPRLPNICSRDKGKQTRPESGKNNQNLTLAGTLGLFLIFGLVAIFKEGIKEGNFKWFTDFFQSKPAVEKREAANVSRNLEVTLQKFKADAAAIQLEAIKQQKVTEGMTLAQVTRSLGPYQTRTRVPLERGGDKVEFCLEYPNGERVSFDYDGTVFSASDGIIYTRPRK